MAEDGSPQRGPSGQPECSEIWLTEPEVTDEETIEDQNKVEQQECGNRRCCDLSKNSTTPTKHPKDGRYLAKRGGIRLQAQTPRTSVTQGRWSKGRYICNVSIGVLVTCAWRTAQKPCSRKTSLLQCPVASAEAARKDASAALTATRKDAEQKP
ncbi:hypothetical protein MRX96_012707 [Rhipicephalus microplus]